MATKKMSKWKNISLWVLQFLLAFWVVMGATYMMSHHAELSSEWAKMLPGFFWILFGVIQIVCGLGIIVPLVVKSLRKCITPSANGIAVIFLLGIVLYSEYGSLAGALWGIIPALIAFFIGRARK